MKHEMIDKYPTYGEIDNASFNQLNEWKHNLRKPTRTNYHAVRYIEEVKYQFILELYEKKLKKIHNW